MKISKCVMIIASMLVAYNAYAEGLTLKGGVLLSHAEERGVPLPDHLKHSLHSSSKQSSTTASANYASGNHGNNISASGNVGYQIYNGSSSRQYYYVDTYMCIDNTNCTHARDSLYLDPHLNASGSGYVYTSAYISSAGNYEDEAIIVVSGAENSSAKGINTVHVS